MTAGTATTSMDAAAAARPAPRTRDRVRALRPAVYPIAFPIVSIVNFWSGTNADPNDIVRSLLVGTAVALALSFLAGLVAGPTRGGLAASAILAGLLAPASTAAGPALILAGLLVVVEGAIHRGDPSGAGRSSTVSWSPWRRSCSSPSASSS